MAVSQIAFIATLGTEPQVVTVTLDLLLEKHVARFDRVVVIHTVPKPDDPQDKIAQSIAEVRRELAGYQAEGGVGHCEFIELRREDGAIIPDIYTQEDADAVFTTLRRAVREQKRAGRLIHLNAAGGRKGMTLYAMAAAQMHFDAEDRLWLLASSEAFQASRALHPRSADDARLIPIPVYRFADRTRSEFERKRAFLNQRLTGRERQIVEGIARHRWTARQIADALDLSEKTVENRIYEDIFPELRAFLGREDVSRQDIVAEFAPYFAAIADGDLPR